MAWLRSSQEIEGHPKTLRLMSLTGWDMDTTIGRLHRFWWWVQKYAESGDLSPFTWAEIDAGLKLPAGQNFLKLLIESRLVDEAPFIHVHDWWDHNGPWLQSKYKQYPDKWMTIKERYISIQNANRSLNSTSNQATNRTEDVDVTERTKQAVRLGARAKRETGTATPQPEKPLPKKDSTNGSTTGSTTGDDGGTKVEASDELTQTQKFISENLPKDVPPPDFQASAPNGFTLSAAVDFYAESGVKAAWELFVDPSGNSFAWAKGQRFSVREFLRQINELAMLPGYPGINRRHREQIWRRCRAGALVKELINA